MPAGSERLRREGREREKNIKATHRKAIGRLRLGARNIRAVAEPT